MRKIVMNKAKQAAMAQITRMTSSDGPVLADAAHAAAGDIRDIKRIFVFSMTAPPVFESV
ncbi:MAG: hypothetical protein P4L92_03410 [Rudaea sp.]|nr:hypothetical protein [Rudaea sp.]